jgi:hypothetical protein
VRPDILRVEWNSERDEHAMSNPDSQAAVSVLAAFFGFAVGCLVAFLALGMSGVGHGWNSAFVSSISVVGAPLAAVAWTRRGKPSGRVLAICAIVLAVGIDYVLLTATTAEGVDYVSKVWTVIPASMATWGVLFLSWQLLAAVVCAIPSKERRSP